MQIVTVTREGELDAALARLGLRGPRPVVVLVGGAAGLDEERAGPAVAAVAHAAALGGAIVVDGATDSGVARLVAAARAAGGTFPLLGVAVAALVAAPGAAPGGDRVALEPSHEHVLLVPGSRWGDEVPWLQRVASLLAGGAPSVTVLVNGGEISVADAEASVAAGRRTLVAAGSGRAADAVAAARADDTRLGRLAGSQLVRVAGAAAIERELVTALGGG